MLLEFVLSVLPAIFGQLYELGVESKPHINRYVNKVSQGRTLRHTAALVFTRVVYPIN